MVWISDILQSKLSESDGNLLFMTLLGLFMCPWSVAARFSLRASADFRTLVECRQSHVGAFKSELSSRSRLTTSPDPSKDNTRFTLWVWSFFWPRVADYDWKGRPWSWGWDYAWPGSLEPWWPAPYPKHIHPALVHDIMHKLTHTRSGWKVKEIPKKRDVLVCRFTPDQQELTLRPNAGLCTMTQEEY